MSAARSMSEARGGDDLGVSVGIDIGGTKTAAAAVYPDGSLAGRIDAPTPAHEGAAAVLDCAAGLAERVSSELGIVPVGFGIGSAGAFDTVGRVVHATDHLAGWTGTDVAGYLRDRFGAPAVAVNDVHAAALGELWSGPVQRARFLFVAIGTGIGGAVVSSARVLHGRSGLAGSVGHVSISSAHRRVCSCGGVNHVEAFASGPGIERTYLDFTGDRLGLRDIGRLAAGGDIVAAQVIRVAAEDLGESLAASVTLLDPGEIVLGGGVSGLGDLFLAPIVESLRSSLRAPFDEVAVSIARLGPDAAIVGAGGLASRIAAGAAAADHFV
ncbi:ROK family protein [Leifsonia sp. NPDC058292]|uniref:ROK family protein n=1 Tax=Leifsonia sp. NPDC058292 TaxID=3346428 RepID=UPI0036DA3863